MSAYYSLPLLRLYKKEKIKKLNILPLNFEKSFYKSWAEDIDTRIGTSVFQQNIVRNDNPSEDVKNFLLAAYEFGQDIQSDIDLYVTKGKLNEASFRQKLDPIAKNVIRNENLLELVFKDVSKFDT